MKIEVKPAVNYKAPSYPDMEKASLNPELLKKLPERWRYNKAVVATIIALSSITMTSCSAAREKGNIKTRSGDVTLSVAPVFEHGNGTGSLGCSSVAPPAFLSEQEAMAIIKSEALKAGINLDDTPDKYPVQAHSNLGSAVGLEASDKENDIAVTFISNTESKLDENKTISTPSGTMQTSSSVTNFKMKQRAKDAASDWKNKNIPYAVGTFYDPGINSEKTSDLRKEIYETSGLNIKEKDEKYITEAKKIAEEDLRAQVKDFIEWLRGQGVI